MLSRRLQCRECAVSNLSNSVTVGCVAHETLASSCLIVSLWLDILLVDCCRCPKSPWVLGLCSVLFDVDKGQTLQVSNCGFWVSRPKSQQLPAP